MLSVIGKLAPDEEKLAASDTQRVYGGGGDWHATLRKRLSLGDTYEESLRRGWNEYDQRARQLGVTLTPEEFARGVAGEMIPLYNEPAPK